MKDFDAQRHEREANTDGRSFTIGGAQLVAKASISPDIWIDYFDRRRANAAGDSPMSNREYLDFLDAHVCVVVEPESVAVWEQVRASSDPAITLADIDAVIEFLWELQSGRPPTEQSDSSANGSATASSETSSTDSSSLEPAEALTV